MLEIKNTNRSVVFDELINKLDRAEESNVKTKISKPSNRIPMNCGTTTKMREYPKTKNGTEANLGRMNQLCSS